MDGPAFESLQEKEGVLFSDTSIPAMGPTQPPVQWVLGFIPGVERQGLAVDRYLPNIAKAKEFNSTSNPVTRLTGVDRENLTFLFNKYKYLVSLPNQTKSCCMYRVFHDFGA